MKGQIKSLYNYENSLTLWAFYKKSCSLNPASIIVWEPLISDQRTVSNIQRWSCRKWQAPYTIRPALEPLDIIYKEVAWGFLGGIWWSKLPTNAGDTSLMPGPQRTPHALRQLSLWTATIEAVLYSTGTRKRQAVLKPTCLGTRRVAPRSLQLRKPAAAWTKTQLWQNNKVIFFKKS